MDSGANCDDESYGIMTRPLIIICFSADRTPISFSSKNGSPTITSDPKLRLSVDSLLRVFSMYIYLTSVAI